MFEVTGKNPLLDIATELEKIALEDDYFISRKLYPNVDFYSGLIYEALGMPVEMFPVLFAIGRTSGWIAQWLEMIDDKEQKIARPRQIYTGKHDLDYVPDLRAPVSGGLARSYLSRMGRTDNPGRRIARLSVRVGLVAGLALALTLGALAGSRPTVVLQTALATGRCRVPRLKGLAVQKARARAAKAGCRLRMRGAPVKQPLIQTVARQRPRAGRRAKTVTIWVNPACFRTGLSGPPAGEPLVKPGPTELVTWTVPRGRPARAVLIAALRVRARAAVGRHDRGQRSRERRADRERNRRPRASSPRSIWPPGHTTSAATFAQAQTNDQPIHARTQTVTVSCRQDRPPGHHS